MKLKLIDTSALLHSGNALFPSFGVGAKDKFLNSNYSFPTGAMYGVLSQFKKNGILNLSSNKKNRVIFCFDRPSFRKKISSTYKSNRPKNPGLLLQSIELEKGLRAMGFDVVALDGYEADDLIAALVKENYNEYSEIEIYATDRDLSALVDHKVTLVSTNKRVPTITLSNFSKKAIPGVDIPYNTMYLFKIMFGDHSDCIPAILPLNDTNYTAFIGTVNKLRTKFPNGSDLNSEAALDTFINTIGNDKIKEQLILSKKLVLPKWPADTVITPPINRELNEHAIITFLGTFKMKSIAKALNVLYDPTIGNDYIKSLNKRLCELHVNNENNKSAVDVSKLEDKTKDAVAELEKLF